MTEAITHNGNEIQLHRRGQTWHMAATVGGKRVRRTTGQQERAAAIQTAREIVGGMLKQASQRGAIRMSDALKGIWQERWQHQAATIRKRYVEDAMQRQGDPLLSDISRQWLMDLRQSWIDDGIKPATVNRKMSAVLTVLRTARDDWDMKIKVPKIRAMHEPEGRYRYLSDAEIDQLLEIARPPYAEVFAFLIETGLRRGELLDLTWDRIDMQQGRVYVVGGDQDGRRNSKSGKTRSVPITEARQAYFRERMKDHPDRPWDLTVMGLRWEWQRCRKEMGLENDPAFVLHTLRHTTATRMLNRGTPTRVVQKWLGHSSVSTTEKYLNQSDRDLDQWLDRVAL